MKKRRENIYSRLSISGKLTMFGAASLQCNVFWSRFFPFCERSDKRIFLERRKVEYRGEKPLGATKPAAA